MGEWKSLPIVDLVVDKGVVGGPFGSKLGTKDYVSSGVPVIRGSNLSSNERFDLSDFTFVTEEKVQRDLVRNLAHPGDVVVTQRGTLGQVGIIPAMPYDKYVVSQSQMAIKVNPDLAYAEYIYYSLNSPEVSTKIRDQAITTGVPHINVEILSAIEISVPPLKVQSSIAEVLNALDDKIAVNERISRSSFELIDTIASSRLETAQLERNLGDVIRLRYGKSLPNARRLPGDVPVYGSGGVSGHHDEALADGPGVIIGRKGTVGAVYWSQRSYFPIDTVFYASVVDEGIPLEVVYFMLRRLKLDGMNSDSAVPGLNRKNVESLKVRVPDAETLNTLGRKCREMFSLIESRETESRSLAQLRDTLLPKLMSGEIRVRDAEKAVEEAT